MQNKDDTKQLRRDISLELKIHINSGQKPEFEHQMHNHLPNQEEHKDHVIEETPQWYGSTQNSYIWPFYLKSDWKMVEGIAWEDGEVF